MGCFGYDQDGIIELIFYVNSDSYLYAFLTFETGEL